MPVYMQLDLASRQDAFKEYDIRGVYPEEVDEALTAMVASVLAERVFKAGKVVLGRDGRHSSPSLYQAAIAALQKYPNLEIVDVGLMTTPALYFLVNDLKASGGIMITASHNAKHMNGIKAVGKRAEFIGGKTIYAMLQ